MKHTDNSSTFELTTPAASTETSALSETVAVKQPTTLRRIGGTVVAMAIAYVTISIIEKGLSTGWRWMRSKKIAEEAAAAKRTADAEKAEWRDDLADAIGSAVNERIGHKIESGFERLNANQATMNGSILTLVSQQTNLGTQVGRMNSSMEQLIATLQSQANLKAAPAVVEAPKVEVLSAKAAA